LKARLVQIGNSRGIRLPKTVLAEAQLEDEVELKAEPGCIIIRSARRPRAGWAEAAQQMRKRGEDQLLDRPVSTRFDREDWKWR
jgi:antitoxin MazE